ncbi:MAG: DNA polymerase III subunit delta' C-terminal domain-containing protein [Pseudomonadota bacterium]
MKIRLYPWFQEQWNIVAKLPKNHFPHALIITGQSGIGKQGFSLLLIQSLLCEKLNQSIETNTTDISAVQNNLPCGICSSCAQVKAGSHGDFLTLEIIPGKKSIGVDQIREMIHWMNLTHKSGHKKVLFIPAADKMTLQASNALLKTLEEPPADVVIILLVDHIKSLIATMRSRCQIITLAKPDQQLISQWLHESVSDWEVKSESIAYSPENHELLLSLAFHTPLKVKKLLTSDILSQRKLILEQLFSIVEQQNAPVLASGKLSKIAIEEVVYWLQAIIFDLIYMHFKVENKKLINLDYRQQLISISLNLNTLLLFELLKDLNQYYFFQGNSLNLPLLLDSYLIKWSNCVKIK